jgi:uncharacterized glyoxalase superfamily protein PhnB
MASVLALSLYAHPAALPQTTLSQTTSPQTTPPQTALPQTTPTQSNSASTKSSLIQSQAKKENPMKFSKITPNLVVADLDKSLKFYRDVLGFSIAQTVPDKAPFIFAWMKHGGAELFLNVNMPPQPGEPDLYAGKSIGGGTLSLYLVMEGIDELYATVQQQKVPIVIAMHKQFYGMKEFAIHDPDGHLLIFAEEAR